MIYGKFAGNCAPVKKVQVTFLFDNMLRVDLRVRKRNYEHCSLPRKGFGVPMTFSTLSPSEPIYLKTQKVRGKLSIIQEKSVSFVTDVEVHLYYLKKYSTQLSKITFIHCQISLRPVTLWLNPLVTNCLFVS